MGRGGAAFSSRAIDYTVRVLGEGPIPCEIMLIGEYPGIDEILTGRNFVGKSGRELERYLNGYGLPPRGDLYLTNLRKSFPPKEKRGAALKLSDDDLAAIFEEVAAVDPVVIVTLGAGPLHFFCGEDANLEAYHGIPHACTVPGLEGVTVMPCYNPAAMLHAPKLQAAFAYDMRRLELLIKGKLPSAPVDEREGVYTLLHGAEVACVQFP